MRLTLLMQGGRILRVFLPVVDPESNAAAVDNWLRDHGSAQTGLRMHPPGSQI
jgi:hypothetical protein